ncbi:MAG: putative sugar nucleotidyl transferase [Planctomycetota bacterium]|jgi:UDP-N-acetylglucosamine diphosphorylase/glucosamine-1-phosphate N-acetyltransferase
MRIALFEDAACAGFAPVAHTRPVFELLCGHFSLRERLIRSLEVHEWGVFIRSQLAEVYREEQPEAFVNDFTWLAEEPTLLINGRWLPTADQIAELTGIEDDVVGISDGRVAFLLVSSFETPLLADEDFDDPLLKIAGTRTAIEADGHWIERPWNLIDLNSELLEQDFASRATTGGLAIPEGAAVLGDPQHVFIHPTAEVDPFVVIDARGGSVFVDADARLQAFTRLEGPLHVGRGTQVFRANVKAGTTLGPVCRIGGEIENSIVHGYSNKYHDGFLGHSYVGEWVNLGALTTNSDLKNDYSQVRVPLEGEPIDSGSKKVGCFIGDHTKTALCSQFNTGSSIGVMTMILPGGELLPKHVPSFSRVWHGEIDNRLDLESGLQTARMAMSRRNCDLSPAQERLFRRLYLQTEQERHDAVSRVKARKAGFSIVRP